MIKVVVLTTGKANDDRKANIERTKSFINVEGYNFIIQTDIWGVGTANHIHALNVEPKYESLIVLEDDAYLSKNFESLFNFHILDNVVDSLQNSLVSFFTPKTRPQDCQKAIKKQIDKLSKNNMEFFTLPRLVTGVGYYVPANVAREMFKYAKAIKLIDENGLPHKNLTKNADFTIGKLYKAVTGNYIKYCYPSIVEHLNKGQQSDVWVGDEHLTIDRSAWAFWDDIYE